MKNPEIFPPGIYLYGYRAGDINQVVIGQTCGYSFKWQTRYTGHYKPCDPTRDLPRAPKAVLLDEHLLVPGMAPYFADNDDPITFCNGVHYRVLRPMELHINRRKLKRFVRLQCLKYLPQLKPGKDYSSRKSVEEWLADTHYDETQKKELLTYYDEHYRGVISPKLLRKAKEVSLFQKAEFYSEPKYSRGINGRTIAAKLILGPIAKDMEKLAYHTDFGGMQFIKLFSIGSRPVELRKLFSESDEICSTDWSSFERHFKSALMSSVELTVAKWLCQFYPEWFKIIRFLLTGENKMTSKFFTVSVDETRMTGEMFTSLFNGITNLMIMKYIAAEYGAEVKGFVEGDDAVTKWTKIPNPELFAKFGFQVKMEISSSIERAGFCGYMFDKDNNLVQDPFKVLQHFPWSFSRRAFSLKNRKGLLLAKALSFAFSTPRAPVIWALILRSIQLAGEIKPIFDQADAWWDNYVFGKDWRESTKQQILRVGPPSESMRQLVADEFGMPISEQLSIEQAILTGSPISVQEDFCDYNHFDKYVRFREHAFGRMIDFPDIAAYNREATAIYNAHYYYMARGSQKRTKFPL